MAKKNVAQVISLEEQREITANTHGTYVSIESNDPSHPQVEDPNTLQVANVIYRKRSTTNVEFLSLPEPPVPAEISLVAFSCGLSWK